MLFGAGGVATSYFGREGGMLLGFEFMLRPEYNISKNFSAGLELKHYIYPGEGINKLIFSGAVFISYNY